MPVRRLSMRSQVLGFILILGGCVTEAAPGRLVPGLDQKYITLSHHAEVLPCKYRRPKIGRGTTRRAGEYCLRPIDGEIEDPSSELAAGTQIRVLSSLFEAPTTCVLIVGLPERYYLETALLRSRDISVLLGREPRSRRGRVQCE